MSNFETNSYSSSVEVVSKSWPLASSTPMQTNNTCIIYNNINYNEITINESSAAKKPRKSVKKAVSGKPIMAKKTTSNAIKPSGNNYKNGAKTVERILAQINMAKYAHLFKNYDVERFKMLRELDLNAMGITRPQELRTFKEAIVKAKCENINV